MPLTADDVLWDGELPIVIVLNERDEYVCIKQGGEALERAAQWVADHPEEQPVIFSVHDQRCPHCSRTFWHEAQTGSEETGWHCPLCDKLLTPAKAERLTVGDVLKAESDALHNAMTGLANADTYFEGPQQKWESAEDYYTAACRVRMAAEALEEKASKFLREAEEEADETEDERDHRETLPGAEAAEDISDKLT